MGLKVVKKSWHSVPLFLCGPCPNPLLILKVANCLVLCSEIQSLQDEVPELKNRLTKAEADLVKAIEGEKKASDEVSQIVKTKEKKKIFLFIKLLEARN